MRARQPDQSGYAANGDVCLYYKVHGAVHGADTLTILLVPAYQIVHSRL